MVTIMPSSDYFGDRIRVSIRAPKKLAFAALLTFCACLCGCVGAGIKGAATTTTGSAVNAILTTTNSTVSFGSVVVGQTGTAFVQLANDSSSAITISKLTISGSSFSSSAQNSLPITVGAQSSVNLGV